MALKMSTDMVIVAHVLVLMVWTYKFFNVTQKWYLNVKVTDTLT